MRSSFLKSLWAGVPVAAVMACGMSAAKAGDWAEHWAELEVEHYGSVQLNYDAYPDDAQYADQDDAMGNVDLRPQMVVMTNEYEFVLEPRVVVPHRALLMLI